MTTFTQIKTPRLSRQSMQLTPAQPIGIFDSGIGGLTIARAVASLLPQENLIYFGDTAHFPYGDQSKDAILSHSRQITEFLLKKNCKLVLIACHSASAIATPLLQSFLERQALLINVIDPLVNSIAAQYSKQRIGLIGTKRTVNSKVYAKAFAAKDRSIDLAMLATPMLAPLIEESFLNASHNSHKMLNGMLEIYLNSHKLHGINALALACTHYPLIKDKIRNLSQDKVALLDAGEITAQAVKDLLAEHNLLHQGEKSQQHFYLSAYNEAFAKSARNFFGSEIVLEHGVLRI